MLKRAAAVVACAFALVWLLSAVGTGFTAPTWVPPAFAIAICVAVFL